MTIVAIFALIVVALLVYAATRPDTFRVERSIRIQAPPDKIFPLINDLHQWEAWSPWEKVDPAVQRSYSGAPSGPGAVYAWQGNNKVGQGRMEITATTPPARVLMKIDFIKPFEGHNTIEFTLVPEGEATRVTHAMYGPSSFVSKLMGLFFSMDSMIGNKFAEGLASLKTLAEK